jgi:hypothetical protein
MEIESLRSPELIENDGDSHLEQVFVRSRTVVSRSVAGETLIVPVRGKVGDLASIYSFNGAGSLIWQSLEVPKTAAELTAAVEREYSVDQEQARRDVEQFINDMLSVELVTSRPAVHVANASRLG